MSIHIPARRPGPDRSGIDGLPMTLLITMVVLAITVPMIFGSLRAYDRGRVEVSLISEIEQLMSMAQMVYASGPGNSVMVVFKATSGSMTDIDYVSFGDEPGGNLSSTVRYRIRGGPEHLIPVSSPNVPMRSSDNGTFSIFSGTHSIVVECASAESDGPPVNFVRLRLLEQ